MCTLKAVSPTPPPKKEIFLYCWRLGSPRRSHHYVYSFQTHFALLLASSYMNSWVNLIYFWFIKAWVSLRMRMSESSKWWSALMLKRFLFHPCLCKCCEIKSSQSALFRIWTLLFMTWYSQLVITWLDDWGILFPLLPCCGPHPLAIFFTVPEELWVTHRETEGKGANTHSVLFLFFTSLSKWFWWGKRSDR